MLSTKAKENVKLILIIFGMLTMATFILFMSTRNENYVSAVDLEGQNEVISGTSYATFNAGFGNESITSHSAILDVDERTPSFLLVLSMTGGCTIYNPTFQFLTESGSTKINYDIGFGTISLVNRDTKEELVKSSSDTNNTLCLKDLTNGVGITLNLSPDFEKCAQTNQTSIVRFTGQIQDPSGTTTSISKDIYINVGWTSNCSMELEQRVSKYYRDNRTEKLIIQTSITNQLSSKRSLPVQQTQLVVDAPTYEGFEPEAVSVTAERTSATNGKDETNVVFNSSNYSYNSANRKITITVNNNPDASGNVSYGRGTDEYLITYTYPKGAYDAFVAAGTTILNKVSGSMTLYSNTSTTTVTKTINATLSVKSEFGMETGLTTKFALYANAISGNDNWYSGVGRILSYRVSKAENIASIKMEFGSMTFYTDTATYSGYDNATNKNYNPISVFSIPEQSFKDFLGNDGYIRIYDDNYQHKIGEITTSTSKNADGEYEFEIPPEYQTSSQNLNLWLSKPQTNLKTLDIHYTRIIRGGVFTLEEAQKVVRADAELNTYTAKASTPDTFENDNDPLTIDEVKFVDTYTNAELNVDTENLNGANSGWQELNFKILFDNKRIDTDIWNEPYFDIELPSYITDIDTTTSQVRLVNGEGFTAAKKAEVAKFDGKYHLFVSYGGNQEQYGKVTALEQNLNVKVDKYTPNCTEEIKVNYINRAVKAYKTNGSWEYGKLIFNDLPAGISAGFTKGEINFTNTPTLLCVSELTGYNGDQTINSEDNGNTAAQIERNKAIRPTMNLILQNNYSTPVSNIVVLGRIPYTNNKYVIASADLGTNINTTLASRLQTTSGKSMTIYYSDNLNATQDLSLASNNWKTDVSSLANIKSYLIVVNDTLATGEKLEFSYQFDVPAQTLYNKSLYASFGAYYNAEGTARTGETAKIGLTTQKEGSINVQKTAEIIGGGTTVSEGDVIKYTIRIENNSPEAINNVVLRDTIPENTTYAKKEGATYTKDASVTEIEETIATIAANSSYTYEFYVIVNEIIANTNIQNTATVIVDGYEPIPSNTTSIQAEVSTPADDMLEVKKTSSIIHTGTAVKEGDLITYTITVKNVSRITARNVVITDKIPQRTVYYDTTTNTTKPDITTVNSDTKETLAPGESFEFSFTVQVLEINENTTIRNVATVQGDNVPEIKSNTEEIKAEITVPNLRLEKTSSIEKGAVVKEGDLITYTLTVYNDGTASAYDIEIKDRVPEHTAYYENGAVDREKVDVGKTIEVLEAGKSESYSFTVIVEEIPQNGTIKNTASVQGKNGPETPSNTLEINAEISEPKLSLEKTSNIKEGQTITAGDIIEYTIVVTNIGDCIAHNVVITDKIPENTIYVDKLGSKYAKDESKKEVTKIIESLNPGDSETLTFCVMVGTLNENVQIVNTASVNANNGEETSSNTIGISAKPKTAIKGGDLPYTGTYSLIIILSVAIISLSVFAVFEYKRIRRR